MCSMCESLGREPLVYYSPHSLWVQPQCLVRTSLAPDSSVSSGQPCRWYSQPAANKRIQEINHSLNCSILVAIYIFMRSRLQTYLHGQEQKYHFILRLFWGLSLLNTLIFKLLQHLWKIEHAIINSQNTKQQFFFFLYILLFFRLLYFNSNTIS